MQLRIKILLIITLIINVSYAQEVKEQEIPKLWNEINTIVKAYKDQGNKLTKEYLLKLAHQYSGKIGLECFDSVIDIIDPEKVVMMESLIKTVEIHEGQERLGWCVLTITRENIESDIEQ
jgi:hypothetical protein